MGKSRFLLNLRLFSDPRCTFLTYRKEFTLKKEKRWVLVNQVKQRQQTDNCETFLLKDHVGKMGRYSKKEGPDLGRRRSDLSVRDTVLIEARLSMGTRD
jgi:hypothetical protein